MSKIVRITVAAALAVLGVTALSVGTAQASASIDITFSVGDDTSDLVVGDTNVPMTVSITNNNDGSESVLSNTLCDEGSTSPCNEEPQGAEGITFVPSCALLDSVCRQGDPDVFRLSATAQATSNFPANTSCQGRVFDIVPIDTVLGLYHLTPQTAPEVVLAPGEECTLTFSGDVINAPKVDQDPNVAGVQTGQYADVEAKVGNLNLPAFDANTDQATILKAKPNFWTKASASVALGSDLITDTATLTGRVNPEATGTVTFKLYPPSDSTCSGAPVDVSTVEIPASTNSVTSKGFKPMTAGAYRWVASYSGDRNNLPAAGACNDADETVTVTIGKPMIMTQASASIPANGGELTDTATLSKFGTLLPGGTIMFYLYGPDDKTCAGTPVWTDKKEVPKDGSSVTSEGHRPTVPGTYYWVAEYSGDANHMGVKGTCGEATETVVVTKAKPKIVTQASASVPVNVGQLTDTAQLQDAALTAVTGTITFRLYGPTDPTCTGTPVFTDPDNPFTGAPITSDRYTPTVAGTYRWVASYSGDANNETAIGTCGDPTETVEVTGTNVTLPATGSDTGWQLMLAAALTAAGVAFVFAAQRRRGLTTS